MTVTLEVDVADVDYKSCSVTVPAGSNGGDVLDAAVASGCLIRWSSQEFPSFGRYVECIDVICGAVATYWEFWTNGEYSSVGIDHFFVAEGDTLRFNYVQWVLPL